MNFSVARAFVYYGVGALAAATIGIVSFQLVNLRQTFGFSPLEEGLALSIITLSGAVLGLGVSVLIARLSVQRVLLGGLVILGLSNILAILGDNGTVFLLSRGLASIGFVALVTALPGAISTIESTPVRQATLIMWGAYLPIGIVMGIAICMTTGWDWQFCLGLHTGLCVTMAGVLQLLPVDSANSDQGALDIWGFLSSASVWMFALGFGAFAAIFLVIIGLLPSVLQDATGLSQAEAGLYASFVCLTGVATSVALSIFRPEPAYFICLIVFGFLASAAGSTLFFLNLDAPMTATLAAVLVIAASALVPSLVFASFPLLINDTRHIILLSGLVAQFGNAGSLLGPPAVRQWSALYGWSNAWVPISLICIFGALMFISPGRRIARFSGPKKTSLKIS